MSGVGVECTWANPKSATDCGGRDPVDLIIFFPRLRLVSTLNSRRGGAERDRATSGGFRTTRKGKLLLSSGGSIVVIVRYLEQKMGHAEKKNQCLIDIYLKYMRWKIEMEEKMKCDHKDGREIEENKI